MLCDNKLSSCFKTFFNFFSGVSLPQYNFHFNIGDKNSKGKYYNFRGAEVVSSLGVQR